MTQPIFVIVASILYWARTIDDLDYWSLLMPFSAFFYRPLDYDILYGIGGFIEQILEEHFEEKASIYCVERKCENNRYTITINRPPIDRSYSDLRTIVSVVVNGNSHTIVVVPDPVNRCKTKKFCCDEIGVCDSVHYVLALLRQLPLHERGDELFE